MNKSNFNQNKKQRTEVSRIGISIRNNQIYVVKTPREKGVFVYKSHVFVMSPDLTVPQNLDHCISQLPDGFFDGAATVLCVPFKDTVKNQVNFPVMASNDLAIALENMIEKDKEEGAVQRLCQYQKEGKPFLNLTLHKVPKDVIESYISVFDKHKITIKKATTEPMVMAALGETNIVETGAATSLVADLDDHSLKLYVFQDNELVYSRFIPIGYHQFIAAVCKTMVIGDQTIAYSEDEAKTLFQTQHLFESKKSDHGIPFDRLFFQIRPTAEKVVLEIKKTISFYSKMSQADPIQQVYTTGMFDNLNHFVTYLKDVGKLNAQPLAFGSNYQVNPRQSDPIYRSMVYFCLGVAHDQSRFNLLPQSYQEHQQSKKIAKLVVGVMVVWMFVMIGLLFNYKKDLLTQEQDLSKRENEIKILELKVGQMSNLKSTRFSLSKDIDFVNQVLMSKVPVETIVYDMSVTVQAPLQLTQLAVGKESVMLAGVIPAGATQDSLMIFIEKIERLPYIKHVVFDTQLSDSGQTTVELEGFFN